MPDKVFIFDSTLRDGAQARGITFSLADKLHMLELLDGLGVHYIEAGNPASNPKEKDFFDKAGEIELHNARLVAFGSTCRKDLEPADDPGVQALLSANTPAVAIFGKSWDLHVTEVLRASLAQNLDMIRKTIAYFKGMGKEVVYDAEHFFDGYRANPEYAMQTLQAAQQGGADVLCLCDTNGGAMPWEVYDATGKCIDELDCMIGIHCHNDAGLAVANSLYAVRAGARHVQGTLLGFGERCGNTNLSTIIPDLQFKMGFETIGREKLKTLYTISMKAADIANMKFDDKAPFIGRDAFSHKGGMHIDGVNKISRSFEHIDPELVGNRRGFLLSEVAGKTAVSTKLESRFPQLSRDSSATRELVEKLKQLEADGYSFEGAESSFELIVMKHLGLHTPRFELMHFRVMDEPLSNGNGKSAYAVVKLNVNGEDTMAAAEGNGPVNALDKALREALVKFYPQLSEVSLTDYKVRVLDTRSATAAKVRVVIESTDGQKEWATLGVSSDVIEASLLALIDSIEYKLL